MRMIDSTSKLEGPRQAGMSVSRNHLSMQDRPKYRVTWRQGEGPRGARKRADGDFAQAPKNHCGLVVPNIIVTQLAPKRQSL